MNTEVKDNSPITEKYRPKVVGEVVGQDEHIELLQGLIEDGALAFPHLLLFGPPGTGKTTAARIIMRGLHDCQGSLPGDSYKSV